MSQTPRRVVFASYPVVASEAALIPVGEHGRLDRHPAAVYIASLSPGSRRTMRGALRAIASILSGVPDELRMPWALVDYAHASLVRTVLAERLAPATANRFLAALRGTLKAAFKLGLITADHYTRVSMIEPVRGSRLPKGRDVSGGELRALFDACDSRTAGGARDAGLLAILFGGGLRRAEVVALDLDSFDPATGALVILGKGRKERKGWVTNGSREALDAWLAIRGADPGPLFLPVRRGGHIERRRMTDAAVAELVHRIALKARVAALSPHDARRTFVGSLLSLSVDLSTVQQLAGHASPTTTARYDRRSEQTRKAASELLHVPFVRRES
jgi:site-specific recombinase XerC